MEAIGEELSNKYERISRTIIAPGLSLLEVEIVYFKDRINWMWHPN